MNNSFVEPGSFNFADCFGNCYETPFEFNSHKTSYIGGFFLGYRWQMGKTPFGGTVFGVEGDINFKKGESSQVQSSITSWGLHETFTGSQKQGTDGSLRLRVGTLITPWTLVYFTGGLAVGSVSGSFSYAGCEFVTCSSGGTNVTGAGSWSQTRTGGTVGAGVESEFWQELRRGSSTATRTSASFPRTCLCPTTAAVSVHPRRAAPMPTSISVPPITESCSALGSSFPRSGCEALVGRERFPFPRERKPLFSLLMMRFLASLQD